MPTTVANSARDSRAETRGPYIEPRLLLGPGPSPVHERILEALARPTVGHLDPQFLATGPAARPYLYLYYVEDATPGDTAPVWNDASARSRSAPDAISSRAAHGPVSPL